VSPNSINVSWSVPLQNGDTLTEYVVNITTLRTFDPPFTGLGYGASPISSTSKPKSEDGSKTGKLKTIEVDHSNDSYVQAHMANMATKNSTGVITTTVASVDDNAEDKVEAKMMQINVS